MVLNIIGKGIVVIVYKIFIKFIIIDEILIFINFFISIFKFINIYKNDFMRKFLL